MLDAGQDGRIADLVAIEVQDREHGSIGNWVEKLVGLPCGRQGPRFCFTVADDTSDDQIGIVERSSEGVAERISQLATFVNGPRRRRSNMAGDASGKRELCEQLFQPGFILADVWIDLSCRNLRGKRCPPMPGRRAQGQQCKTYPGHTS